MIIVRVTMFRERFVETVLQSLWEIIVGVLFHSASAGWNIEQEAFMQDVTVINKLKLRAGYGFIGNQNIGNYAYSDIYSSNYNYPFGGTSVSGYAQTKLGNPNLKWETSNQFNVGQLIWNC